MKKPILVSRYARGLARAAGSDSDARRALKELRALAKPLTDVSPMVQVLTSPRLDTDNKEDVLETISKTFRIGKASRRFLSVLLEKRRVDLLPEIVEAFHAILSEREGVVTAKVRTAVPLGRNRRQRLVKILSRRFKARVLLEPAVDKDLLGGVLVQVEERLLAGDLRTRLLKMASRLDVGAARKF